MLFSSPIFLLLFLPVALLADRLPQVKLRNAALFLASLVFYAWGEPWIVCVMVGSIAVNFGLGRAIAAAHPRGQRGRSLVAVAVLANLGLLGWFKYANFVSDNLADLAGWVGIDLPTLAPIHLPIGISFFTFQALSYVVDVYRGTVPAARNAIDFGLYLALFPQLIAGPIVRYHEVAAELPVRDVRLEAAAHGLRRFVRGLAQKVLIANGVATAVDPIFALPPGALSCDVAWFGALAFAVEIYFDFAGYSDMAIGLGQMLGLDFPENFARPYSARSITDFWRRWHMTLSRWFRDYLYVPRGGNRRGRARTLANLVLVFFLCGLWHGARWTFVLWGLLHGAFLIAERLVGEGRLRRLPHPVGRLYTLFVVVVAWVFFRAESLTGALDYLAALFGLGGEPTPGYGLALYAQGAALWSFVLGVLLCLPGASTRLRPARSAPGHAIVVLAHLALLALCLTFVVAGTQNPFIYFRF